MDSIQNDFQRLWSYSVGFYGVWVAHIGRKLGLFRTLKDNKAMTPNALAQATGFYLPAVEAWCSAAAAYGFIGRRSGGRYWLPRRMMSLLEDRLSPQYLGGQFSYLAMRSLEYGGLDDLFRYGKTRQMSNNTFEAIEEATHWDHHALLRAIKGDKRLQTMMAKGCAVADIGCGTGSLLTKLCNEYPMSRYFGADPSDEAVALARKNLKGRSVTIAKVDGERLPFSDEFDIVYLGESLYASSDKATFLRNCYRSLRRGGTLMILEGLVPENGVEGNDNNDMVILGMQLDFALQGHRFMQKQELMGLVREAGFKKTVLMPLGGSVYLASARK